MKAKKKAKIKAKKKVAIVNIVLDILMLILLIYTDYTLKYTTSDYIVDVIRICTSIKLSYNTLIIAL